MVNAGRESTAPVRRPTSGNIVSVWPRHAARARHDPGTAAVPADAADRSVPAVNITPPVCPEPATAPGHPPGRSSPTSTTPRAARRPGPRPPSLDPGPARPLGARPRALVLDPRCSIPGCSCSTPVAGHLVLDPRAQRRPGPSRPQSPHRNRTPAGQPGPAPAGMGRVPSCPQARATVTRRDTNGERDSRDRSRRAATGTYTFRPHAPQRVRDDLACDCH